MDPIHIFNTFAVGLVAGLVFYGGLWLTVRSLRRTNQPGLFFLGSFLARSSASLALLWYGAGPDWRHLAMAVLVMLLVRTTLTRLLGPPRPTSGNTAGNAEQ